VIASWLLIGLMIYGLLWILKHPYHANADNVLSKDNAPIATLSTPLLTTTNSELIEWIKKLGENENCPTDGLIDTNGLRSYGRFCYQEQTFKTFVRKYNLLPNAEETEYMNFIGDEDVQMALTILVFRDSLSNWTHWQNTVLRIGMPPIKTS